MTLRLLAGIALFRCHQSHDSQSTSMQANVEAFIDKMVSEHDYDRATLETFSAKPSSRNRLSSRFASLPKEPDLGRLPPDFHDQGTRQGRHDVLARTPRRLRSVSERHGVPVEIIVGIIGVETYYGRITGGIACSMR